MIGICPRIRIRFRFRFLPPLQNPCECAEERSFKRIRASDCLSEASSSSTPLEASTGRCPQRSGGTQTPGSPFLLLTLLLAKQKKSESPAAATERHQDLAKNAVIESRRRLRQAQPERGWERNSQAGVFRVRASPQLKCFPTIPASSNIVTCAFPNTGNNFASALMARLLAASCSFSALM